MSIPTTVLTLVGNGSVGKTSIINRFQDDGFAKQYKQTVGCDFFEKTVEFHRARVEESMLRMGASNFSWGAKACHHWGGQEGGCYERGGNSRRENPIALHGAESSWRIEAEDRCGPR